MQVSRSFAQLLQSHLKERGWSASSLARRLQMNRSSVGRWLNNQQLPDRATTTRLVDVLMLTGAARRELLLAAVNQAHLSTTPTRLVSYEGEAVIAPISAMPHHRNRHFVGRAQELQAIAASLASPGALVAIVGMGGVGKTALAIETVYREGPLFPGGVFWLNFAEPELIAGQVIACGQRGHLNLHERFATLDAREQLQLVLAAWRLPLPRLLIFDNCEDETLVLRWFPTAGGCRLLITSRRSSYDPALGIALVHLGELRRSESLIFLRQLVADGRAKQLKKLHAKLDEVAAAVGDHPLALTLAGHTLRTYGLERITAMLPPKPLLDPASLETVAPSSRPHPMLHAGLWQAFARSYQHLSGDGAVQCTARMLLARAAHFAPGERIPLQLLQDALVRALPVAEEEFRLALHRLVGELGLLEQVDHRTLRIHELITSFVRGISDDAAAVDDVAQTLLAQLLLPNHVGLPADPLILHHLRTLASQRSRQDALEAQICFALGEYLWCEQQPIAVRHLERAIAIAEASPEVEPLTLAIYLNTTGLARYLIDAPLQAAEDFRRSLSIRLAQLPPGHVDVRNSLGNLGFTYLFLADYAQAQPILTDMRRAELAAYGVDHPSYAQLVWYLGFLYLAYGKYRTARCLLKLALTIDERSLAAPHPQIAKILTYLAESYSRLGELQTALLLHERACEIRTQLFGRKSHVVAENLRLLAYLEAKQGNHERATGLAEQAFELTHQILGDQHSETLLCLELLGVVNWLSGQNQLARQHLAALHARLEQRWGERHRYGVVCTHSLGLVAWSQGALVEAKSWLEQALRVDMGRQEHPEAALTVRALERMGLGLRPTPDDVRPPTLMPL